MSITSYHRIHKEIWKCSQASPQTIKHCNVNSIENIPQLTKLSWKTNMQCFTGIETFSIGEKIIQKPGLILTRQQEQITGLMKNLTPNNVVIFWLHLTVIRMSVLFSLLGLSFCNSSDLLSNLVYRPSLAFSTSLDNAMGAPHSTDFSSVPSIYTPWSTSCSSSQPSFLT